MRTIAVGSTNPVKVRAVENAVKKIWPGAVVVSVEVDSGVSEQPTSDEEAIEGAVNRAKRALQKTESDLGVGLEGCTVDLAHGMFLSGWVAAVDRNGKTGLGSGGRLLLPESVAGEVREGKELGPVMDAFTGARNTKQDRGAVGILTGGLVPRTDAFERSVIFALTKFSNPELYAHET